MNVASIKSNLKSGYFTLSNHAEERAEECNIKIGCTIKSLIMNGTCTEGKNPTGPVLIFRKKLDNGREVRMIVGESKYNSEAFIVSLYKTDEGDDSIGKRAYKFSDREVVYEFG